VVGRAALAHVDAFNLTAIRYGVAAPLLLAILGAAERTRGGATRTELHHHPRRRRLNGDVETRRRRDRHAKRRTVPVSP
jgi:hypothetical protein